MERMRILRIGIGAAICLAAAAALWWCATKRPEGVALRRATPELYRFAAGERREIETRLDAPRVLSAGAPIFVIERNGKPRQVGEVRTTHRTAAGEDAPADRAEIMLYAGSPELSPGSQLVYYETPGSLEWVLKTMLPPEKRAAVVKEMSDAFAENQEEILAALRPVVEASFREAFAVVEEDLAASLARHKPQFEQLGGKYQREIVEREIVPLVRQEIWPIVRRHGEPAAEEVGREIWQRASLWRFGWRYAYDQSPLPDRNLVRAEWNRFVEREVVPILESHTDDFIHVQQAILSDVAKNPRVQMTVRKSLAKIVDDPEVQQLVWQIIREVVIDNPRLKAVMHKHWTGPEARAAFTLAAERLEPSAVRIGELLFGSREEGISPEFARVLRNQILGKDKRWLVLEVSTTPPGAISWPSATKSETDKGTLPCRIGGEPRVNPFVSEKVGGALHL